MKYEKLQKVRNELSRMLAAMNALDNEASVTGGAADPRNGYYYGYPKYTGAVRRASMELTRALADLRRHD